MDAPSMVQRSGDTLIIRSVVSGDQIFWSGGSIGDDNHTDNESPNEQQHQQQQQQHRKQIRRQLIADNSNDICGIEAANDSVDVASNIAKDDGGLPQCKIKRNYSCNSCSYFTQNPRHFLAHLRDLHGEKIIINECKHCLYASRHYQKLVRHMKMVHGSTEGLEEQAQSRKRASQLAREQKKRRQMASGIDGIGGEIPVSMVPAPMIKVKHLEKAVTTATSDIQAPAASASASDAIAANSNEFLNHKFLKCSLCDFTTLYRTQIVEHERDEHNKTKFFRCQKCSYVTHIKARFSKHVKYHSMPMIKCIMCDFRTPYKWNLDRHMKNHGGTGPFKCSACNFTADIKQSLTVHEMNHHVPPVGHASGMSMAGPRRRNKVGATDVLTDNGENSNDGFDITPADMMQIELSEQSYSSVPSTLAAALKKPLRPIPNLIPIQPLTVPASNDAVNLTTRSKIRPVDESELKELSDVQMSRKCDSILKDFATLFGAGGDEALDGSETSQLSPVSNASSVKRKNTNFFNELKEKFATGNRDGNNLSCQCGHASKCLSEAIIHKKSCGKILGKGHSTSPINLSMQSNSGSTRCQYCRHRCKTSTDLYIHMQSCLEAARSSADSFDSGSEIESNVDKIDVSGDITDEGLLSMSGEPHPMENKVFVWNKLPSQASADAANSNDVIRKKNNSHAAEDLCGPTSEDSENNEEEKADDSTYYGVETAPGYGEVTKKMNPDDEAMTSSLKKVFKCPHCSFWASTASRFHVHIVGHLNRKPFECSLCSYRSNWRWDITKHIRLKTIRDVSHKSAKVLMNDETGRRNYTKYNKYITLMKVTEEDGDPKLLKSGEMTASQEAAALSFPRKRSDSAMMSQQATAQMVDDEMAGSNAFLFDHSSGNSAQPQQMNAEAGKTASEYDSERASIADAEATKKVSFKCKKCNYRHTSRDVVLAHVKSHYRENADDKKADEFSSPPIPSLTEISSEYNNNVYGFLSAISLTPTTANKILLQPSMLYNAPPQRLGINATTAGQALHPPESKTTITAQAANKATSQTTNNENGEMEEASSGFTSVNGWRGPAPYRCGHCHQVSNWKHVIQRHCRLKHDGDIRIEMTEKGSRMYQPLAVAISGSLASVTETLTATMISTGHHPTKSDDKKPWHLPSATFTESNQKKKPNEPNSAESDETKSISPNPIISQSTKQLDVVKTGIDFTINNNKGEFGCSLCNFEADNAFTLNQHAKMHLNKSDKTNHTVPLTRSAASMGSSGESIDNCMPDDETTTPNATLPKANSEHAKDTNVKQIEKIQELRNQADGSKKRGQSPGRSTHNSKEANDEKCPHCPFRTAESEALKDHMMCHICVSGHIDLANCEYCDFSIADESMLIEHNNIHFDLIKNKQKTVAFYTIYDDLELTTIEQQQNNNDERHPNQYAAVRKLYPKMDNNADFHYSSDKENKILVDINTGQVIMNNY